jgi:membrane fusion protein (multidrug efflux system)
MSTISPAKRKLIGLLLCLGAVVAAAAGAWAWSSGDTFTDNAYVRGDVTSLAPKVAGYVRAVEVEDNETVQAGDVLFRIANTAQGLHRQWPTSKRQKPASPMSMRRPGFSMS